MLAEQFGHASFVFPLSQKEFAEEGIERLLLIAVLLAPASVLLLESGQEPLEHQDGALCRIGFLGRGGEDCRVLAPVGAKLGQAGSGEDERRRGETRKIAIEGCDGL